jgi:hypothetical protein
MHLPPPHGVSFCAHYHNYSNGVIGILGAVGLQKYDLNRFSRSLCVLFPAKSKPHVAIKIRLIGNTTFQTYPLFPASDLCSFVSNVYIQAGRYNISNFWIKTGTQVFYMECLYHEYILIFFKKCVARNVIKK